MVAPKLVVSKVISFPVRVMVGAAMVEPQRSMVLVAVSLTPFAVTVQESVISMSLVGMLLTVIVPDEELTEAYEPPPVNDHVPVVTLVPDGAVVCKALLYQ